MSNQATSCISDNQKTQNAGKPSNVPFSNNKYIQQKTKPLVTKSMARKWGE